MEKSENTQITCPVCGGCGQIRFFQGESRFLLTDDECPTCCGLGSIPVEESKKLHSKIPPEKPKNT